MPMLNVTDEMMDIANKIRGSRGLVYLDTGDIRVREYKDDMEKITVIYSSYDLVQVWAMYITGFVMYSWQENVFISEVSTDQAYKYRVRKYVLSVERSVGYQFIDRATNLRDDFLCGWNARVLTLTQG